MKDTPAQPRRLLQKDFLVKTLPLIAFVAPLALLYLLNPPDPYLNVSAQQSFELMWKGRTFQLFFVWLISLEFILGWESIKNRINLQNRAAAAAYALVLLLPSVYVVLEYYLGLNGAIAAWMQQAGVAFAASMPLAIEYLAFCGLFCVVVFAAFGKRGLLGFALPALFVALIGVLYTIDNMFPYGEFTPFQLLVPTTASLAGGVLGLMGYQVASGTDFVSGMPTLSVSGSVGSATFAIAWPCAGIESLLIFTAVALLFLKRLNISWQAKVGFFVFGAAVTYLINVLRIANIFVLGMQYGVYSHEVDMFHFYYGPLYAMTWIVAYPLIIIAATAAYQKFMQRPPKPPAPA
ncbi:MAG: archaeosortase/exosortase family protein [Candidatus Bathyarchaeota archaeon]|nr:archaeosortase/exosortase family protein [Candidatus Bathyarchaeota archaeon]